MLFSGKKIKCELKFQNQAYTYEIEKHKNIKDLYNLFIESVPNVNYPLTIRLEGNEFPFEEKDLDSPLLSLIKENKENLVFEITKSYRCEYCSNFNNELNNKDINNNNGYISKYCLICCRFICNICAKKSDSIHKTHKLIDINPADLRNSVKLWCIDLIANLSEQITSFKKQSQFMNDNDFLIKLTFWKDNLIKKINKFENLIKDIFEKVKNFNIYYKNLENVYNKIMQNLINNEREMNEDLFLEGEKYIKYFSFDEAEKQIQKLKINYEEIEKLKKDIKPIIDFRNINSMEKYMNNIPMAFDKLVMNSLLIMDNINNYEKRNDIDDIEKIYKYPEFLNHQKSISRSYTFSSNKTEEPTKIEKYFISNRKVALNNNKKKNVNINKNSNNNIEYNDIFGEGGKLITQITKLNDIPASYSIVEYSKYIKNNNENKILSVDSTLKKPNNPKILNLKIIEGKNDNNKINLLKNNNNNLLELPQIIKNSSKKNQNEKINKSVNFSENIKLFTSLNKRPKNNKK